MLLCVLLVVAIAGTLFRRFLLPDLLPASDRASCDHEESTVSIRAEWRDGIGREGDGMQTTRDAILVLCTGNSAAVRWRRPAAPSCRDRFDIFSAGTKPSSLRAEAIAVMAEIGSTSRANAPSPSTSSSAGRSATSSRFVTTRGRAVRFSRRKRSASTGFRGSAAVEGTLAERAGRLRRIRDQIAQRVERFVSGPH